MKERGFLQQALLRVQPLPTEEVIEIFCDYGITAVPNTSNMKREIQCHVQSSEKPPGNG